METSLILGKEAEGFSLTLSNCSNCLDGVSAIKAIKQVVRFLDTRPNNPDRTKKNPEKAELDDDGSTIVGLTFTHPTLALDCVSLGLKWQIAIAKFWYDAKSNSVEVHQTNSPQGETAEEIVQGLVKLAEVIAPILGPTYGTVDISSSKLMPRKIRKFADIRYWCYANIFCNGLVKEAPTDFFPGLPATECTTLPDASLLLKYKQTFSNWYFSPPRTIETYLAAHTPKIQLFRRTAKKKYDHESDE